VVNSTEEAEYHTLDCYQMNMMWYW